MDPVPPDAVVALHFDEPAVADELARWCSGQVEQVPDPDVPGVVHPTIWVPSVRGPRPAPLGYWIIRRGEDDFLPQSPEDFAATHEPLT